jgi:hypothetical protein
MHTETGVGLYLKISLICEVLPYIWNYWQMIIIIVIILSGCAAQRGLWPRGFVITHDAPQSVGITWTSGQLVAETSTHNKHPCTGGIRTHDRSRRAAVDLRLRPRGHWDWLALTNCCKLSKSEFSLKSFSSYRIVKCALRDEQNGRSGGVIRQIFATCVESVSKMWNITAPPFGQHTETNKQKPTIVGDVIFN